MFLYVSGDYYKYKKPGTDEVMTSCHKTMRVAHAIKAMFCLFHVWDLNLILPQTCYRMHVSGPSLWKQLFIQATLTDFNRLFYLFKQMLFNSNRGGIIRLCFILTHAKMETFLNPSERDDSGRTVMTDGSCLLNLPREQECSSPKNTWWYSHLFTL